MSACMSGTRGSGVLSSTCDILVRGVGGVCGMCLARGGVGGEVDERIGFGLYQSCGDMGSVGHVSVFNPVAPYGYLLSDMYVFMADITNPDFLVYSCRTWIGLNITRFCE